MLPKKQRLTTKEFDQAFKDGRGIQVADFAIKKSKSDKSKFAVVVSKKVSGTAVKRNTIKKKVYNAIKNLSKRHSLAPQMSVIVFVRKDKSDTNIKDIEGEIKDLFVKNSLLV